jgi:hypothetical protein
MPGEGVAEINKNISGRNGKCKSLLINAGKK